MILKFFGFLKKNFYINLELTKTRLTNKNFNIKRNGRGFNEKVLVFF